MIDKCMILRDSNFDSSTLWPSLSSLRFLFTPAAWYLNCAPLNFFSAREDDDVCSSISTGDVREQTCIASLDPDSCLPELLCLLSNDMLHNNKADVIYVSLEYVAALSEVLYMTVKLYAVFTWTQSPAHELVGRSRSCPSQPCVCKRATLLQTDVFPLLPHCSLYSHPVQIPCFCSGFQTN